MSLPIPRVGLVIRHAFLWSHEQAAGRSEASKDRPAVIVMAIRKKEDDGDITVAVAPITHSPPDPSSAAIEIPADVCRQLGLDGQRHWLIADEINRFAWPGYDLRPIPANGNYEYGMLPRPLFDALKAKIIERQEAKNISVQNRDE